MTIEWLFSLKENAKFPHSCEFIGFCWKHGWGIVLLMKIKMGSSLIKAFKSFVL